MHSREVAHVEMRKNEQYKLSFDNFISGNDIGETVWRVKDLYYETKAKDLEMERVCVTCHRNVNLAKCGIPIPGRGFTEPRLHALRLVTIIYCRKNLFVPPESLPQGTPALSTSLT